MARTATNPQTGEKVQWDEGAENWVPIPAPEKSFQQRVDEKPFLEQMLIGMGRGMSNVGRQVGNILEPILPESLGVSDKELASYSALDKPILNTGGGMTGNIVGEMAALAPLAGGAVGAGARGMGAMMPAARTAMGATRTGQVASGAGTGLAEGALEGSLLAGPDNRASGALTGSLLGGTGGAALPLITKGFRTPSDSAKTLMEMTPSPDLTPGMMKPGGMLNQLEQAAGSIGIAGPVVRGARETPQRQFAQAMINEGRPPGSPPIAGTDVNAMLDEAYGAFEPAYGQLKGFPLEPSIGPMLSKDFDRAANSQIVAATDDTRKAVSKYLKNQVTRFRDKADSDDLLEMRSNIREQGRKAAKSQNWEKAELFEQAENAISGRLNETLPEGFSELNKAIDTQYAKHKITENAIFKMGNREYPTPSQWQQAVRESSDKGQFARGGGLLRPQTKAASDVFKTTEPTTGARLATLMSVGGGAAGAAGLATGGIDPASAAALGIPLALLAATKGGRRAAVGEAELQKLMQRASQPQPFMSAGIPDLPGQYLRSIAPISGTDEGSR